MRDTHKSVDLDEFDMTFTQTGGNKFVPNPPVFMELKTKMMSMWNVVKDNKSIIAYAISQLKLEEPARSKLVTPPQQLL